MKQAGSNAGLFESSVEIIVLNSGLKRYRLFAWDYGINNPLNESEVNWYKGHALKTGGPILELACGTGRLLTKLAETGFAVTGIDLSSEMLETATGIVRTLPCEIRDRITLVNGDMTAFSFPHQFGLILIADNSFRELRTKEDQISCLSAVYRHLLPDGLFLMTVTRFEFSGYVNGTRETTWSKPIVDPTNGYHVSRKVIFALDGDNKRLEGRYLYRIVEPGGVERFEECPFGSPVLLENDYHTLLAEIGFTTRLLYGYDNKTDKDTQTLCFVCSK